MGQSELVAGRILDGFTDYRQRYNEMTAGAGQRFARADWRGVQTASVGRIALYNQTKELVCRQLQNEQAIPWQSVREAYCGLLSERSDGELAATFYNSIFRLLAGREHLNDEHAFLSGFKPDRIGSNDALTTKYRGQRAADVIRSALQASDHAASLIDIDADVDRIDARLTAMIPLLRGDHAILLELLNPVFYRNKGAYLVGRLFIDQHVIPVALALCHVQKPEEDTSQGVVVDAFLWGESRLSVLFSFTRTYFMVDIPDPLPLVSYLQMLLPVKKRWELLTSIGFFKHGKTEFVRGYRNHLKQSTDKFSVSEGIRGQVMMVFGLASYQTVFKVIKDRFPATKSVSHEDVRNAYRLVKTHDRVGRMADTQEFHAFQFPKDRFEPALLEELTNVAANSVSVNENTITIRHLYAERMMTPLNLYIQRCGDFQLTQVLDDYGLAIKDLAAANIFPGDMLLKNFGVTRHGRVVFYDYDEICYLTDVNFRDMPARKSTDTLSADAWFDVGEYDVFPEEFSTFLFPDADMRMRFEINHGDLFTAAGWQAIQDRIHANLISDVYPYPQRERLV